MTIDSPVLHQLPALEQTFSTGSILKHTAMPNCSASVVVYILVAFAVSH